MRDRPDRGSPRRRPGARVRSTRPARQKKGRIRWPDTPLLTVRGPCARPARALVAGARVLRAAQHRARALGGQSDRGVAGRGGLVDGERAVGGAEAQRVRQGLLSSPIWSPVKTSNSRSDSRRSPAPSRSAFSTASADTSCPTTSATSWVATGKVEIRGAWSAPSTACSRTSSSTSMAQVRSGRWSSLMTRGCSSPACPKRVSSPFTVTYSAAHRPGCHGAC